ncbi:MAG: hypothetical protein H7A24_17435 [Leptospiraceae bacterium]|nr:hypothetical protein [Leptospiraceae bacterium]MCP5513676.1 hypothetical protein [Leptospiraceae bacterium]
MLSPNLKSKIDLLRNKFWTAGITNPLGVIEQITDLLALALREQTVAKENTTGLTSTSPNATATSNYFTLAITNNSGSSENWFLFSDTTCTSQIHSFGSVATSSTTVYSKFYTSGTYYFKIGDYCQSTGKDFYIGANYLCTSEPSQWGCETVTATSSSIRESLIEKPNKIEIN